MDNIKFFSTSSKHYFNEHGKQFIDSFSEYTKHNITLYSEDIQEGTYKNCNVIRIKYIDLLTKFQKKFRKNMGIKLNLLPYHSRLDIWSIKIAIQLQFIEDNPNCIGVYIDSDSVIISKKFERVISKFISPVKDFDIGIFRRYKNHLHPESGFLVINNFNRKKLLKIYKKMFEKVINFDFSDLVTLTDCSLIDREIENKNLNYFDFCSEYNITSKNPMYHSDLRKALIHLKGPRKGKYSFLKKLFGRYY